MFNNSINCSFTFIKGGGFYMGAGDNERFARNNEKPCHKIKVASFYISTYLITQESYIKIMHNNPSYFSPSGDGYNIVQHINTDRFPVDSVSWDDAMEFCRRLSSLPSEKKMGCSYRLPTETEWEYACRAGHDCIFGTGNTFTSNDANINGLYPYDSEIIGNSMNRPTVVGSYPPNDFGLYDMHGNVWEWCLDTYKMYDSNKVPNENARVLRGGSWTCYSRFCRSAYRCINERTAHFYDYGFRIICELKK